MKGAARVRAGRPPEDKRQHWTLQMRKTRRNRNNRITLNHERTEELSMFPWILMLIIEVIWRGEVQEGLKGRRIRQKEQMGRGWGLSLRKREGEIGNKATHVTEKGICRTENEIRD